MRKRSSLRPWHLLARRERTGGILSQQPDLRRGAAAGWNVVRPPSSAPSIVCTRAVPDPRRARRKRWRRGLGRTPYADRNCRLARDPEGSPAADTGRTENRCGCSRSIQGSILDPSQHRLCRRHTRKSKTPLPPHRAQPIHTGHRRVQRGVMMIGPASRSASTSWKFPSMEEDNYVTAYQ